LHSDGLQQRVEELEKQKDDIKTKYKLLQEVSEISHSHSRIIILNLIILNLNLMFFSKQKFSSF
jgi:hypothetical protein